MEGFHPFCRVCPGGKYSDFFQLSTCEKKKSLYIEKSLGEAVSSANVAQSVEQLTRNEQVIGSNPIIGSILDFFQRSPPGDTEILSDLSENLPVCLHLP